MQGSRTPFGDRLKYGGSYGEINESGSQSSNVLGPTKRIVQYKKRKNGKKYTKEERKKNKLPQEYKRKKEGEKIASGIISRSVEE